MSRHHEVIVIGGGQAGLAAGYHLARQGRDFTILEAAAQPAAAWRSRWDSLKLFTPARYDGLPGRAFPGDPDHYPTRDEVVEYLTDYAGRFDLPVELDSRVRAVRAAEAGYVIEVGDRTLTSDQVIVATGPFQTPRMPGQLAELLDPDVVQLHSSDYRTPGGLPDGRVLVVGGGNTGFQIAEELAADREVHLAIGSRQTPLPTSVFGRGLFDVFESTGLMGMSVDSRLGRRLKGRDALVGSSPRRARAQGIALHGRAQHVAGRQVEFSDGTSIAVDAVVWATGFGRDHSWVDAPVFDQSGHVVHQRGVTPAPGLYFLGLPWLYTRGSALLGWVKHDAEYLAEQVAKAQPGRRAAAPRACRPVAGPAVTPAP